MPQLSYSEPLGVGSNPRRTLSGDDPPTVPRCASSKTATRPVYDALTSAFDFVNKDQELWWHSTAPLLETTLQLCRYPAAAQQRHLRLYKDRIVPFLGAYPRSDSDRWKKSILTLYGIPFEMSVNCSQSVVRYGFDPIGAATADGDRDPFGTKAILEPLEKLAEMEPKVDLKLFRHFTQHLTLDEDESRRLNDGDALKDCIKTQTQLALDLKGEKFMLKTYMYPHLKAVATGKSVQELIFASVRDASEHGAVLAGVDTLEAYMRSRGAVTETEVGGSTITVRFLSYDLVKPDTARIKVYMLERNLSLAALEHLWTLGGLRDDPSTREGLALLRELWAILGIQDAVRGYPEHFVALGEAVPPDVKLPCMVNYTLHPDDAMPEPQLYLPAFGMRDAQVADNLAAFFKRCGWEDMADNYKRKLWECFPNDDHELSNYLHTFISFSYRGGKPYLSVYMHSFEGGNWPALPNSRISFDRYRAKVLA